MREYMRIEILSIDTNNKKGEKIIDPLTNTVCLDEFANSGDLVTFFADLACDKEQLNKMLELFFYESEAQDPLEYLLSVQAKVTSSYGELISKIILIGTYNLFIIRPKKFDVKALKDLLYISLNDTCKCAFIYAYMFTNEDNSEHEEDQGAQYKGVIDTFSDIMNINYDIKPTLVNGTLKFIDKYQMDTSRTAIKFDFISILKHNKSIKKCENCGKFFIPTIRSDEIYCDNIFKNNKTCKQIGYEIKVNNDKFMKVYRTAYKTKNAYKNRNMNNNPHAEADFNNWVEKAKSKLNDAQIGEITLDEYKHWLKYGSLE